jgi:hypothetical protein
MRFKKENGWNPNQKRFALLDLGKLRGDANERKPRTRTDGSAESDAQPYCGNSHPK